MNFEANRHREPEELSAAWRNWKNLQEEAERFFALPEVQQALNNDTYRLTKFTAEFDAEARTRARPRRWDAKSDARGRFRSYWQMTNAIDCAANHTQKMLHKIGKFDGLLEMSKIMEQCNLLIRGSTLETSYQDIETVVIPEPQVIEGLRIHFVFAFMNLLYATEGKLVPENPKRLVTETHGLHAVVTHEDPEVRSRIRKVNGFATRPELEEAYAWGDVTRDKLFNRLLGLEIRTEHMHVHGAEKVQSSGFKMPADAIETTQISEVCTAAALEHMSPLFFAHPPQWGIGPDGKDGNLINLRKTNVSRQILGARTNMTKGILHYPKDHPAMQEK